MFSIAIRSRLAKSFIFASIVLSLSPGLLQSEACAQAAAQPNLILQARHAEQTGNLVEAERIYQRVLATDLTSQEAHHRLGVLAAQRGDLNRAIPHFTTAEGLGVVTVQLLNDFGGTLFLKGDLVAAEEKLRKALVIDPGNRQARDNLALVEGTRRKRAQAQSAALVRQIAEMRAAEDTRAAARAIAQAKVAARVRKLAEARAKAETSAAAQQIARLHQSKPVTINVRQPESYLSGKPQSKPANPVVQQTKPSVKTPPSSKPVARYLQPSKPAKSSRPAAKPVVTTPPTTKPEIATPPADKPAAKDVRVASTLRVKPNSQTSGRILKPTPAPKKSSPNKTAQPTPPTKLVTRLPSFPPSILVKKKSSQPTKKPAVVIADKTKPTFSKPKTENAVSMFKPSSIKMVSGSQAGQDNAVQQAANPADASWRRAQVLLAQGKTTSAMESIESALRSQPKTARYLLTQARCLADQAQFTQAKSVAKSVEVSPVASPVEKAQALAILGSLTLESGSQDAAKALTMYMQAINLSQPFTTNSNSDIRRASQAVQIEANLGVAHAIGRGRWNKKSTAVPVWIGRTEKLAQTMIETEGSPLGLRLEVIESALRAYSSFEPAISPEDHLRRAEAVASQIWSKGDDPTDKAVAQWRLGLIYVHAIKLAAARKDTTKASQYAQRAHEYLEKSVAERSSSYRARYELAKAYYWMGAGAASSGQGSEKTLDWYTRSAALLVSTGQQGAFYPTDTGTALVTMGDAFWQAKLTQKAVETTEAGTSLLQDAVDQGSKDRQSLTQAYARLTEMHHKLGHQQQADATSKKPTLIR